MRAIRKKRLLLSLVVVSMLGAGVLTILYALRQNINLFYTPTELVAGKAPKATNIRLGGMGVKGSVRHEKKNLKVHFSLTDFNQTIRVAYRGILPTLFREGQGIVTEGKLNQSGEFVAKEVLAKHDANYMPPEVKKSIKKARA